jgi:hypothetical protein
MSAARLRSNGQRECVQCEAIRKRELRLSRKISTEKSK